MLLKVMFHEKKARVFQFLKKGTNYLLLNGEIKFIVTLERLQEKRPKWPQINCCIHPTNYLVFIVKQRRNLKLSQEASSARNQCPTLTPPPHTHTHTNTPSLTFSPKVESQYNEVPWYPKKLFIKVGSSLSEDPVITNYLVSSKNIHHSMAF